MSSENRDDRTARLEEAIRRRREQAGSAPALPSRPADVVAKLGEMQRSLWFLHRLEPASAAYNLASAFRTSGRLDEQRLQRALDEVCAAHRILRSNFVSSQGEVIQSIDHERRLTLEKFVVPASAIEARATAEACRPFVLESGPLVRLILVCAEDSEQTLLALIAHHIVLDERSLVIFWTQFCQAFSTPGTVAPPARQFDDFVHAAAERSQDDRERQLDFWRARLDPAPQDLDLPFSRTLADGSDRHGRLLRRPTEAGLMNRIEQTAARLSTTPFAVLAFAFRVLLARYTDSADVAFGTPISTRTRRETAEMLGYFLNPVVLNVAIDEDAGVEEALGAFAREIGRCRAHASLPFDELTEHFGPERRGASHPFFQTMFVLQEATDPLRLQDVVLEPIELDLGVAKFDLTLFTTVRSGELELGVEFVSQRFAEETMACLLGHYETLIANLVAGSTSPVAAIEMLTVEERLEIEEGSRGAELVADRAALLPERIAEQCGLRRDRPAVACGANQWTWQELEQRARSVTHDLVRLGVEPGDRVALIVDRSCELVAGLLGILWAGAAYVPIDPSYPDERNRDVLDDAEVAAIVTQRRFVESVPSSMMERVVLADADRQARDRDEALAPIAAVSGERPAYLLYTSGSTGRPRGVVISHANLRTSNQARETYYGPPPDRFLLLSSVAFDSSVAGIFWTLSTGGTLILPTPEQARDVRKLVDVVAEKRPTTLLTVPSLYGALIGFADEVRLASLKVAIVAGEACPAGLASRHFEIAPQARLFNEYGPTEATVWATVHEIDACLHRRRFRSADRFPESPSRFSTLDDVSYRNRSLGRPGSRSDGRRGLLAARRRNGSAVRRRRRGDALRPATASSGTRRKNSSSSDGSTIRSRSGAIASSRPRSRPLSKATPTSERRSSSLAALALIQTTRISSSPSR